MSTTVQSTVYGGTKEAYALAAQKAIQEGVVFLKEALLKQDANCQKVFFSLLEMFRKFRAQIAEDSNSLLKECFGRRRGMGDVSYTYLNNQYLTYGDRLKKILGNYLPQLMEGKEPKAGDANCQIHFRTFDFPDLDKMNSAFKKKPHQLNEKEAELVQDSYKIRYYLEKSGMTREMYAIQSNRMRFISAKVYWMIQDKLIPVTEFICIYDAALAPDAAVKKMKENPKAVENLSNGFELIDPSPCVLIRHMEVEFIELCLKSAAAIFERIVTCKNPDEKTLKKDLVEMRYRFSYIMPFERGSAAVGEWFEETLSRFQGIHSELPKGTMGDFEAFSNPFFPNFQKKYSEILKLTPSNKN